MLARKKLDDILDLIRFELEIDVISVKPDFVSVSTDPSGVRVYPLPSQVPNPRKNIEPDEFMAFVSKSEMLLRTRYLILSQRRKLGSAFHFYRTGRCRAVREQVLELVDCAGVPCRKQAKAEISWPKSKKDCCLS